MPINENMNEKVLSQTNLEIPRSRFQKTYETLTTFNPGYWFPVCCQEVLPGENINVLSKSLVRELSPATPVMDQAFLDLATFYVPCRLCTDQPGQFERMMGAVGEPDAWTTTLGGEDLLAEEGNYVSFNTASSTAFAIKSMSLANYLGLPINVDQINPVNSVSMLPFKAVTRIWNEWLRDENVSPSVDFGPSEPLYMTTPLYSICTQQAFNYFMSARKLKDYFTSALPAPQKGAVTSIPFLSTAPVVTSNTISSSYSTNPLYWARTDTGAMVSNGQLGVSPEANKTVVNSTSIGSSNLVSVAPKNLVADLSKATGLTANDIRMVFGIQRLQEKLARGGSRWNEYLHALYGVQVNPGLVNMSVYLGGYTIDVNTQEVVQTSATSDVSPLGFPGAQSVNYGDKSFSAGFQEHGYVITLATVRVKQSYSQGIEPMWRRMHFHDFFQPTLGFIGEQPIYQEELFPTSGNARYNVSGVANPDATIFGYKPAWEEYRKPKKLVTGNFAPDSNDASLSVWTYTTFFKTNAPQLNGNFIRENSTNLLKTLVDTKTKTAFIGDFVFLVDDFTPVPLNSYAGLIDHF